VSVTGGGKEGGREEAQGFPHPDWIPPEAAAADQVVRQWTDDKLGALRRERGLDDEVETTRKFVINTIPEYADRFLIELIQNAHDALPPAGGGRIAIILDTRAPDAPELLIANSGVPFRFRDFRSLSRMALSEKPPGQGIGHKGVGFKSVLQVAPQPQIFSVASPASGERYEGFRFTFPDQDTYDRLIPPDSGMPRMTPYSLPVTIPLDEQPESVRVLASRGFVTTIRLPMRASALPTAERALLEILHADAPILLFLDRIEELTVTRRSTDGEVTERLVREETRLLDGQACHVSTLDLRELGSYLLIQSEVVEQTFCGAVEVDVADRLVDEEWAKWTGDAPIAVALPLDPQACHERLYCYLPLAAEAVPPLAGHVHAPFAVGLARKGLIQGSRINTVLLDAIADLCVAATREIVEEQFHAAVVDLVAWPRDTGRIVKAWRDQGLEPAEVEFVPVVGSGPRGSMSKTYAFDPEGVTQFTPHAVVSTTGDRIVDPAIGLRRTQALTALALQALGVDLYPPESVRAGWAESIARSLPRHDPTELDLAAWLAFYDDLPRVFDGLSGRALAGRAIVLGEDEELLEAWSETPAKRTRRVRGVFFAARDGDGAEGDAWDGPVPRSLRGTITRVHPQLDWYVPGDSIRRNRPGRAFLEQHGLVRVHRTEDLLRLIERVLGSTRVQSPAGLARATAIWRDALLFVYRLTRPGQRHPDLKALNLHRMKFCVPTRSGWMPAESAYFSNGWTPSGADLEVVIEAATGVSDELTDLAGSLLQPPEAWSPRPGSDADWVELLGHCGVRDGLQPQTIGSADRTITGSGSRWSDLGRLASDLGIPDPNRYQWIDTIDRDGWPHHEGAEYIASKPPSRLPGQEGFARLPDDARTAYARLVIRKLAEWNDEVLEIELRRRYGGGGDSKVVPTPAGLFLRRAPWLPVSRPGSRGDEDWVGTSDAWFIATSEREPYFVPVVIPELRNLVPGSDALERLRSLGAHEWSNPKDAGARIDLLGRLLLEGRAQPGFHAQIRNATEDAWKWVVESAQSELLPLTGLVVTRGARLEAVPPSTPCYVVANADRMLELVLTSLEEPVLVAPPDLGPKVSSRLVQGGYAARLVWPADLQVEVNGIPIKDATDDAELLLGGDREWLRNLVVLTLVLRQSGLRVVTPNVLDAALSRLNQIVLIEASEISLRLEGLRREVPAYSRGVVPVSVDGLLAIAWVNTGDGIGWAALRRLVPAVTDLIGERWARDALENIVRALGDDEDVLSEPDDEAYADAFGVPAARIEELLRGQRQVADLALDRLMPALAYYVGVDAARRACTSAEGQIDVDSALDFALAEWRGEDAEFVVTELAEAARTARGFLAVRDRLRLEFGRFNRVLVALGGKYLPERYEQLHAQAMWSFVASSREQIGDALRAMALGTKADPTTSPEAYLRAIRRLDIAVAGQTDPDAANQLAADPAWQIDHREPPTALLHDRVNSWLASQGAPTLGTTTGLPFIATLREANGRRLRHVLAHQALVIAAWLGRRGLGGAPDWTVATDGAADLVVSSGRLDLAFLGDDDLLREAALQLPWPNGLDATLDLSAIGLTEDDLIAFQSDAERRQHEAARERRGVKVDGRVVTLDADTVEADLAFVMSSIGPEMLAISPADAELGALPAKRDGSKPARPPTAAGRGRPSREKLEAIGLVGEAIAYAWLQHHYGTEHVSWASANRTYFFHDGDLGDDGCGYDFHVTAGRNPTFIEVKTFTGDPGQFELSEGEVGFARSKAHTSAYKVLYISNVGILETRSLLMLPNPLSPRSKDRFRAISAGTKFAFARPPAR
jgi:hypothetical protein